MKIAYIAHWDMSTENGVSKKIVQQISCWISIGHKARLFCASPREMKWLSTNSFPCSVTRSTRGATHFIKTWSLVRDVLSWNPDIVYLRFSFYFPGLAFLMARKPTVLELNTDDVSEYRISMPPPVFLYHMITRNLVFEKSSGVVTVTHEISRRLRDTGYSRPICVIANGINLKDFVVTPPPRNEQPRLVFAGSSGVLWHGVEKIKQMAAAFPHWRFDIIGSKCDDDANNGTNLVFHGHQPFSRYKSIMSSADLAIGTLSLDRKKMKEACPLKVREYLALGLPTIIGYKDTDFPEAYPYLLELPAGENNVARNLGEIERFVSAHKGSRIPRNQIGHIDVMVKENSRIQFFESIVGKKSLPEYS